LMSADLSVSLYSAVAKFGYAQSEYLRIKTGWILSAEPVR
jgi:hypothetical protein